MLVQELAHEEVVRSVKLEQAKEVTKLRQEVEQAAKELASKYERKMKVSVLYTPGYTCHRYIAEPRTCSHAAAVWGLILQHITCQVPGA